MYSHVLGMQMAHLHNEHNALCNHHKVTLFPILLLKGHDYSIVQIMVIMQMSSFAYPEHGNTWSLSLYVLWFETAHAQILQKISSLVLMRKVCPSKK